MQIDGTVKTLGGKDAVDEGLINECLEVMFQWTKLLYRTIQAELLHFEIGNSFVVLNLNAAGDELHKRHPHTTWQCLNHHTLEQDEGSLYFVNILPVYHILPSRSC